MKRLIGAIVAAALLTLGTADAAPAAPTHPVSQDTWAVCYWMKAYLFGGYAGGIYTYAAIEVHWWGSHQVICHYRLPGGAEWVLLYDRISGAYAWIH